jgi:hypothetical protein
LFASAEQEGKSPKGNPDSDNSEDNGEDNPRPNGMTKNSQLE